MASAPIASTSPKQVVDAIYEAFSRGDIPTIVKMVAPGAVWRQSSMLPWGGDYRGPEGAAEFFRKLDETTETMAFEPRENIEHGDEIFSFGLYSGRSRATGRVGSSEWMFRWRVQGGKVVSWTSYIDTAAILTAFD